MWLNFERSLRHCNNDEVEKLKKDLVSQNKYVASLELDLGRVKKKPQSNKRVTLKTCRKTWTSWNSTPAKILLNFTVFPRM